MTDQDHESKKPFTHGATMTDENEESKKSFTHGETMTHEDDEDTLPGFPPADFARAELWGIARDLGHDEVRVLTRIAVRLRDGRAVYGPLDLATDAREFRVTEAREEVEDALVYLACAWLKTQTQEVNR